MRWNAYTPHSKLEQRTQKHSYLTICYSFCCHYRKTHRQCDVMWQPVRKFILCMATLRVTINTSAPLKCDNLCCARILFELHFSNEYTRKTQLINIYTLSHPVIHSKCKHSLALISFRTKDSFMSNQKENLIQSFDFLPSSIHFIQRHRKN